MILISFGLAFCLGKLAQGAIFARHNQLPRHQYDFVIVGGGTAGNVIANRLTEDPATTVLVLEAGGSNENVLLSQVPGLINLLLESNTYDWNYTTAPQPGLNGAMTHYYRGFILGGSSSVNGMSYTRGSSEEFDRYAALAQDDGWSWDSLQPYIHKNEHFTFPENNRNVSGEFDRAHKAHMIDHATGSSSAVVIDPDR